MISIQGQGYGRPGVKDYRYKVKVLPIPGRQYFTDLLDKNESERENVPGLLANEIVITRVVIKASQPLKFRLFFFNSDSFSDEAEVSSVDFNMPMYSTRV